MKSKECFDETLFPCVLSYIQAISIELWGKCTSEAWCRAGADTPIRSSHGFHFISFQPPFHKPPPTIHGMKYDAKKTFEANSKHFLTTFLGIGYNTKDFLEVVLTYYLIQEVSISLFFPVFADHLTCPVNLVLKHSGKQF